MTTHIQKEMRAPKQGQLKMHGTALCIGIILFIVLAEYADKIINDVLPFPTETVRADEPNSNWGNDFGGDGGGGEP